MTNIGSIFKTSNLLRLIWLEKLYQQLFMQGYTEKLKFLGDFVVRLHYVVPPSKSN